MPSDVKCPPGTYYNPVACKCIPQNISVLEKEEEDKSKEGENE